MICYYALCDPSQHLGQHFEVMKTSGKDSNFEGKDIGLWMAGHATYCSAVVVANFIILYEHHTVDAITILFQVMSIGVFFLVFWIESNPNIIRFDDLIGVFSILYTQYITWISLVLSIMIVVLSNFIYIEVTEGMISELIAPLMPYLFLENANKYQELVDFNDQFDKKVQNNF